MTCTFGLPLTHLLSLLSEISDPVPACACACVIGLARSMFVRIVAHKLPLFVTGYIQTDMSKKVKVRLRELATYPSTFLPYLY